MGARVDPRVKPGDEDKRIRAVRSAYYVYEQERSRPIMPTALGEYVNRWTAWTTSGLGSKTTLSLYDGPFHRFFKPPP